MNIPNYYTSSILLLITIGFSVFFFNGCTPETRLLNKIPVNSVEVQVLDKNDQPLNGAQVEASNGRKTITDAEGVANVRFGSVGVYSITDTPTSTCRIFYSYSSHRQRRTIYSSPDGQY